MHLRQTRKHGFQLRAVTSKYEAWPWMGGQEHAIAGVEPLQIIHSIRGTGIGSDPEGYQHQRNSENEKRQVLASEEPCIAESIGYWVRVRFKGRSKL